MAPTTKFVDNQGLFNCSQHPSAVAWAPDGVLAVATGVSLTLLRPGDLAGPRAFAAVGPSGSTAVLEAAGAPRDTVADVHHELAQLRAVAYTSVYPPMQARQAEGAPHAAGARLPRAAGWRGRPR